MLDADLAEIYGYTTKAFNQQVQRNIERFDEDFRFRLTWKELEFCSRSHFVTLNDGRGGNVKYLPYAFTEQGIYMLMTVLKGELAVRQSKTLIRLFKGMKDYIINNQAVIPYDEILKIMAKTDKNAEEISNIKNELGEMIKRSEISPIALDFSKVNDEREFLFMDGEVVEAKDLLIKIYNRAKRKIVIIDNYVSYNTLRLLLEIKTGLEVVIFTSNLNNCLKNSDVEDFRKERADVDVKFMKTKNKVHDRFIILDDEKVFMLGASSKDIGNKVSMIHEVKETKIKNDIIELAKA